MSLKAGRVGVHPADVDPVNGHLSPSAVDSYTKVQADDKFLSKLDATSTYETKSDAAALQPKTLSVPIDMLTGSKLTVESALNNFSVSSSAVTDLISGAEFQDNVNYLVKFGGIVFICVKLTKVTATQWATIFKIPEGYRPAQECKISGYNMSVVIKTNGDVSVAAAQSNSSPALCACWLTDYNV